MRNIWYGVVLLLALAGPSWAAGEAAPALGSDDVVMGKSDAPITIFEYASLTCPHCAEFNVETLPKVKAAWIDTGKAKLIYRNFPLDQLALKAAVVARCGPPEHYYGFIDELFHSQVNWAGATDPLAALQRIALLGGISADKFTACMDDKKLQEQILGERLVAQNQYGINSTPTFFVNGTKVVGALPYDDFAKALSAAAGEAPAAAAPPPPGASTAATPMAAPPSAPTPSPAPPEGWLATIKHWFGY